VPLEFWGRRLTSRWSGRQGLRPAAAQLPGVRRTGTVMWGLIRNLRLRGAIYRGDINAVERLLQAGADPECKNPQGLTALMLAAGQGTEPVIRALVKAGADVNRAETVSNPVTSGVTSLMAACSDSSGSVVAVQTLLELGADPDARDSIGRTAYDYAAISGYSDIVAHFEAIGAPPGNGQITTPV
jgi:ankyrin repeat protein